MWLLNQLSSYLVSLLCLRFNLSFQESIDDIDGSDEGRDEAGKPSFSSIERSAGFLDRELAASGFTRKNEEDIQRVLCFSCSMWDEEEKMEIMLF